jgi:uncharacterized DUF497 family protein
MRFEWDPEKARRNLAKHCVSFDEASSAFADPLLLTIDVVVAHLADDETVRIISARLAERNERRTYEEG